jgi:phosphonoacetaldehyde hydrolase
MRIMSDYSFRRTYRGPLRAAIFDWAGTTVDYGSRAPAVAFQIVFRRIGVEISIAQARQPMGLHKRDHLRAITRMPAVADAWRQVRGRACEEADIDELFDAFIPLQIDCLAEHADLIPGCLEAIAAMQERGIKIGSSTGYDSEMMRVLAAEAAKRGFTPDAAVCGSDVPEGRPAPWMCMENARRLGVYPVEAIVKVDDTIPGIEAGLNCGMWTIAVAKTGNEIGLSREDIESLPRIDYDHRLALAYRRLTQAGAHYVIDGIGDILPCLDDIERRLASGEKP